MYMAELCFLAGVSPRTPVVEVPDLPMVVQLAHRLLTFNATSDPGPGHHRRSARGEGLWVYQRGGQPCRRCGTTIVADTVGPATQERRTYWCPSCQPVL